MKPPASRLEQLSTHFFATLNLRLAEMQAAGKDIIRLDEGSPDMPPPQEIVDALIESASKPDRHSYQPHRGTLALREAWAEMYAKEYQVKLDPENEVLPLLGSKEGIFHLPLALVETGDIVLVPDPGYISYTRGALVAGGLITYLPLLPEQDYLPDISNLSTDILKRTKLLWLNYPNNPTSAVAPLEFFADVIRLAHDYQIIVCHDAAYAQVTYDDYRAPSILEIPGAKDVAVEFNTLSKSHNMAGWRSAVIVGNRQVIQALFKLKTNADSGHFLPILEASTTALTGDQSWIKERNRIYQKRRDTIIRTLNRLGLEPHIPKASLYVWSPIPPGWTSEEFVTSALEKAQVSITPGTVFGSNGEGYVRISLTASDERVHDAMCRIEEWLLK